jgi:hypothetical protein
MKPQSQTWRTPGAILLALAIGVAFAGLGDEIDPAAVPNPGSESELTRLREGAVLNEQPGTFQLVGNRLVFAFDGEARQLVILENLALERVIRLVRQSAAPQSWVVSGTVTEYQGSNYLLIDRAVIRRAGEALSATP